MFATQVEGEREKPVMCLSVCTHTQEWQIRNELLLEDIAKLRRRSHQVLSDDTRLRACRARMGTATPLISPQAAYIEHIRTCYPSWFYAQRERVLQELQSIDQDLVMHSRDSCKTTYIFSKR